MFLPVRLGAQTYQFVVDTGATLNVFDSSLRSQLGTQVDTVTIHATQDTIEMKRYLPPRARIGSLQLSEGAVLCRDLISFREGTGCDVYGILGMDFLKKWIVTIDFDEGRLDFLSAKTKPIPEWGESIQFAYAMFDLRYIPATVGKKGSRCHFMVDTGCVHTGSLKDMHFTRFVESGKFRVTGQKRHGSITGIHLVQVGRLSQLRVGGVQHKNLRLSRRASKSALGLGYLRRFRVTIDFPGDHLYLKKGKRFSEPEHGSMCGTYFLFKQDRIVVDFVDENSPAYAAGVRAKDVLVALSGKPVSQLKPPAIDRLLSTKGKRITMALLRDGKEVEATFTLREYD